MKLRIPRRIKVEDDSSDSENEPLTSTSSGNAQNNIENETEKDKVPLASKVTLSVSSILALLDTIHLYCNTIL